VNIKVSIERLLLDGVPVSSAQGPLLGAAVETELARLLAAGGLEMSLRSGGALASVPGGVVQLAANEPAQLGRQIAQAIYGGIGREQSSTSRTTQGGTHASQK
jgi:hypothetical protein